MDFAATATLELAGKQSFIGVLGFLLVPAATLMASAGLGTQMKIPASIEAALQHFAGGVVISAVASELVPEMKRKEATIPAILIGFSLGVAMLLLIRKFFPEVEEDDDDKEEAKPVGLGAQLLKSVKNVEKGLGLVEEKKVDAGGDGGFHSVPWSSVIPTAIDLLCDGMLVGLSFAAGANAGLILAISIALEMASLGAATVFGMKNKGVDTKTSLIVIAGLAGLIVFSGSISFALASAIQDTPMYFGLLAFGIAACLWLATEDLLMEAHEDADGEKWWITSMFFAGFLIPILLDKMSE